MPLVRAEVCRANWLTAERALAYGLRRKRVWGTRTRCSAESSRRPPRTTPTCAGCSTSRSAACACSRRWATGRWARFATRGRSSSWRSPSRPSPRPSTATTTSATGASRPRPRQQVRAGIGLVLAAALMLGGATLLRSHASWSLDLPVNAIAVCFALVMLITYAIGVGLKTHHVIIWGTRAGGGRAARLGRPGPQQHRPPARGRGRRRSAASSTTASSCRPSGRAAPSTTRTAMLQLTEELVLDRLIHEPGRLAILTVLSSVTRRRLRLPAARHRADQGEPLQPPDQARGRGARGHREALRAQEAQHELALTAEGRQRLASHWEQLERLKHLGERSSAEASMDRR